VLEKSDLKVKREIPEEVKQKIALSIEEELFWAIANLIQVEEHLLQTLYESPEALIYEIGQMISKVRSMRVKLMKQIGISNPLGETWCAAKHLISATYRLMEAGEKCLTHYNDVTNAKKYTDMARQIEELVLLFYVDLLKRMEKDEKAQST